MVRLLMIGAGDRGANYARFALAHPDRVQVVAVAEPREHYRKALAEAHSIPPPNVFTRWEDAARSPKLADAVVIATPDRLHAAPAVTFARLGYHILLEKPMAPNPRDCRRIVRAVEEKGIIFAVGHVMRYTDYTRKLKEIVDAGVIGDIVSLQHLEPVGYWHQAHSYVRGNWRNEAESSPMLLAKSCHDLDWIRYIIGARCVKVSSFGSLKHFRKAEQPAGAASRCLDCEVEPDCPYSAKKIYLGRVARGETGWPVNVLTPDVTVAGLTEALRTGPYGRCVYECDNDVVDHQVVNLLFDGGQTAVFTMTAFNAGGHRRTRIFGTRGELAGDGEQIEHYDFLTDKREVIQTSVADAPILGGHGGGDYRLMQNFIDAVTECDPDRILSGTKATLESHLMVFAAEKARRTNRVVTVPRC